LVVAELGRPHGVRGEVTARLASLEPQELEDLPRLELRTAAGEERPVRIRALRAKQGGWILALAGFEDRDAAKKLRGAVLLAPREDLPEPSADEWYVSDLVGLAVTSDDGRELGKLEEVLRLPAHDVYVVRGESGEILLPAIDDVVLSVDVEAGRMTVHLLPGLADEVGGDSESSEE
jgi:16S rRNA processing protein RimM